METIDKLVHLVRRTENYVPRLSSADFYEKEGVSVLVEDAGYSITLRSQTGDLHVIDGYGPGGRFIEWLEGDETVAQKWLEKLGG
jgi:hypothetical protein